MEVIIGIGFIGFMWLTGYQMYHKTFVYHDETAAIEKDVANYEQVDPHIMDQAYYGQNKFLDSFYDKEMHNTNLDYVVTKTNQVYNGYVNNIIGAVFRDDIRNEKDELAYNVWSHQDKNGKYDLENITNYIDTQRFKYELPIESGTDYLNHIINSVQGNSHYQQPQNTY